jgi:hypothetical protein
MMIVSFAGRGSPHVGAPLATNATGCQDNEPQGRLSPAYKPGPLISCVLSAPGKGVNEKTLSPLAWERAWGKG